MTYLAFDKHLIVSMVNYLPCDESHIHITLKRIQNVFQSSHPNWYLTSHY